MKKLSDYFVSHASFRGQPESGFFWDIFIAVFLLGNYYLQCRRCFCRSEIRLRDDWDGDQLHLLTMKEILLCVN
jgi:hypothetical protein